MKMNAQIGERAMHMVPGKNPGRVQVTPSIRGYRHHVREYAHPIPWMHSRSM
jgi:hypothetical protein